MNKFRKNILNTSKHYNDNVKKIMTKYNISWNEACHIWLKERQQEKINNNIFSIYV